MKRELLFVPSKSQYVRGKRPAVDCILCAISRGDRKVDNLVLAGDRLVFLTLNLFPYNPGHLMVVPRRHVADPRELKPAERRAMERWTDRALDALDEVHAPHGYNIGYNLGRDAGASIAHLHLHIVPRYCNEIGFIDIVGGARVHVADPAETLVQLRKTLAKR